MKQRFRSANWRTGRKVENNSQKDQEKEKSLQENEEGLREMQDNMKCNNIYNRDTRRRRRRAKDRKPI